MAVSSSIWIIAGEDSGDQHGANLARALARLRPDLDLGGLGGPLMREAGVRLAADMTRHAATGLVEVAAKLPFFFRMLSSTAEAIRRENPACVVLIDFPDFNLRLAKRLAGEVPVVYYIAPQLWAWRPGRVEILRRFVKRVLVIFPFEEAFYRERNIQASFVGHPLLDLLAAEKPADLGGELGLDPARRWVGLLPGSRPSEFAHHAQLFTGAARLLRERLPEASFLLSISRTAPAGAEEPFRALPFVTSVRGRGRDVLRAAEVALVASGTATVEAMLLGCPFAMAYRTNRVTHRILRRLVTLDRFAMPNILAGREIVPEFVQDAATPEALAGALAEMLADPARRRTLKQELANVSATLGGPGASGRAAQEILRTAGL